MVKRKWKFVGDYDNPDKRVLIWERKEGKDIHEISIEHEPEGKWDVWQLIAPEGDWDASKGGVEYSEKTLKRAKQVVSKLKKVF